jgi:hypothetical protein
MIDQIQLSAQSADFPDTRASLRLGGITIYAAGDRELARGFKVLAGAIDECAKAHLTLQRVTLSSEVQEHIAGDVDSTVFGAILGHQLSLGILDSVPCAAISGKVFRTYVHNQQLNKFRDHIEGATAKLRLRHIVQVRDVEEELFGQRYWGTRSSTFHILARLVQIGRACYVNAESFCWPTEIENAIHKSLRRVRIIKRARVADNQEPSS